MDLPVLKQSVTKTASSVCRSTIVAGIFFITAFVAHAASADTMVYIRSTQSPSEEVINGFHWEILRQALEKTRDKYGPYRIETAGLMSQASQARDLKDTGGRVTIALMGTTPELERDLTAVHIPVDRNLSGCMVLVIRSADREKFGTVHTADDLKKFSIGIGSRQMVESAFLENGFSKAVRGSDYWGLFSMLENRRFDALPKNILEIAALKDRLGKEFPGLDVEGTVLIHFKWPVYFWFSKTPEGRLLARRTGEGMWRMIEDGAYSELFDRHFKSAIERLGLKQRKIIKLENPLLGSETPLEDKALWFDPESR